jgi:regulator of protease activity HflC (stomatin/prohibitin superfamily)
VESYEHYISIQCESAIRELAAKYPYEAEKEGGISLRSSEDEIAHALSEIVKDRVKKAGIEVVEAKISHLAYTDEIAASMLRVQQADALIAAREKIVVGAVGVVKMAIDELEMNEVAVLSPEKKAALVCNLLVVLCGEEK